MNWFDAAATLVCAVSMALFYFLMESRTKSPRRILTVRGVGYVFARQQD